MDQVEAGFDKYLKHSNGNPLVYDKVQHRFSYMSDTAALPFRHLHVLTIFETPPPTHLYFLEKMRQHRFL